MNFMNKLERRFGRFAISGLMRYVVALYVIGYVIRYAMPNVLSYLTLEPYYIIHNLQIWRIVSWLLFPPSSANIIFIVIMLILYYQLGTALEQTWGAFRFNCFIFGGVIYTIISAFVLYGVGMLLYGVPVFIGSGFTTYYINLSIFLAFALCYPDMRVMLYFIIPIKMKWMALVYAVMAVWSFVQTGWSTRTAIIASAVNLLIFFLLIRRSPVASAKEMRRRRNFKRQVNGGRNGGMGYGYGAGTAGRRAGAGSAGRHAGAGSARSGAKGAPIHKCAICGRTELDDPSLVFRYCSKCKGNYEYCQEHLFTHQHKV